MWLGEGAAASSPQAGPEATRDNGVRSIHRAQGPQLVPGPQATPSPTRTISRRWRAKLRYKAVFIHLFIYVYLLQKRTVQGTGSKQAWGCSPLPTPDSKLRGRKGRLSGREGAHSAHAGFPGGGALVHREAEALCTARSLGEIGPVARSKCQKGERKGGVGCWTQGRGWSHDTHSPAPARQLSASSRWPTGLP